MAKLHDLSAVEQRAALEKGEVSPLELTEHYLERIDQLNPKLHALTTTTAEAALQKAKEQSEVPSPSRADAPLWGIPFADKDLDDRAGVRTTYGSRAFETYIPETSSPIVQDMDRAGGISVGKTNVPEFGFPAYSKNLLPGGYARNAWNPDLDAGGSSSGAAVSVAARMLPLAPGNDAGGSVRIPAAANGLIGLKTSRGRVPGMSGINALAGLGVAGPIARTINDTALLLDGMMKGPNRFALRAPMPPNMPESGSFLDAVQLPPAKLKIGWNTWSPWAPDYEINVDPQVHQVFEQTLELAEVLGHEVHEMTPTAFPDYVDYFRAVWMGGAAGLPLPDEALEYVEPLTAWLVRTGRACPAAQLPVALGALAQFESQIIADYAPYDLVVTPALAMTPRPQDWFDQTDGNLNFVQQCQYTPFTSYVNVAGLPAISLPVGQGKSEFDGETVPIGIQAIGRPGDELTLLRFGKELEEQIHWEDHIPKAAQES